MGKTSFGLGLHVVHIVRSQEMVMKQLKTLPYITRLLIRIGIGPGFCSGKILARFSHTFTFSIICKRYYIFQILRVTSSTRINNCVTGNQLPIKCHIIIRRVITLIFWKQFFLTMYSRGCHGYHKTYIDTHTPSRVLGQSFSLISGADYGLSCSFWFLVVWLALIWT